MCSERRAEIRERAFAVAHRRNEAPVAQAAQRTIVVFRRIESFDLEELRGDRRRA